MWCEGKWHYPSIVNSCLYVTPYRTYVSRKIVLATSLDLHEYVVSLFLPRAPFDVTVSPLAIIRSLIYYDFFALHIFLGIEVPAILWLIRRLRASVISILKFTHKVNMVCSTSTSLQSTFQPARITSFASCGDQWKQYGLAVRQTDKKKSHSLTSRPISPFNLLEYICMAWGTG